jgi:hypothetical protein
MQRDTRALHAGSHKAYRWSWHAYQEGEDTSGN